MTDGETMEATTAPAPQQTGQDKFPTWKIAGHKAADEVSTTVAQKLGTVTQLFSNAIADSNFLRAAFGNLWFIMPIVGVVIGIAAIKNTGGAMLPPSTGLFIALVVIGIIDSVAGLLAFLVFSVVSAVSGNVRNLNELATVFVFGVLWFGAAELVHRIRPITLAGEGEATSEKWWRWLSYFAVLPILTGFILKEVTSVLPWVTSYQVPIAKHELLVGWVGAAVMFGRAVLKTVVLHNYRGRMAAIVIPEIRERSKVESVIALFLRAFVVYAVIWTFLGNRWQTFVTLALFLSFEPILWLGRRFPESTLIHRIVPKSLAKLLAIVLVGQLLLISLQNTYPNRTELMGWAFVLLGSFAVILLILEQFKGKDWPSNWSSRILGILVALVFVAVVQGWISIA